MNNLIEKYNLNEQIFTLIKAGNIEEAKKEYKTKNEVTDEYALEVITFVENSLKEEQTPPGTHKEEPKLKNIFGNNQIYNDNIKAKFPEWDLVPANQIINPRLK